MNLEGLKAKSPGQQTLLDVANTYGKIQELKQSIRSDTAYGSTKSSSYTYDDEIRLTQATTDTGGLFGTDTESFTLDAVGNRIAHSRISGAWTYDANNRLTQRGTGSSATTYQYDEAGNLTGKTESGNKVTQYAYDTQNRLVEVKDGSSNLVARYGYDPMDRRIWKEQYRDKDGNALAQARRTYYLYADEGLIAEATQAITLNDDESVTSSSAPEIVAQYGVRPGTAFTTGILFVKARNSNDQDVVVYYHHDHLGTPMQATDKIGNVVWSASYNDFGRATITTPDATMDNPTIKSNLRLPGQVEDAETGLHYNWHRYYDPSVGRYITSDPIGLAGGINTYAYVGGNPISFTDPTGLIKHVTGKTIDCGKGCTIRIDYVLDEKTGAVKRHLHWECKKEAGACGENGDKSHGGSWDQVPEHIKECARRHGFQGDSQTSTSTSKDVWAAVGIGAVVVGGIILAPEITIPAILLGGTAN